MAGPEFFQAAKDCVIFWIVGIGWNEAMNRRQSQNGVEPCNSASLSAFLNDYSES